MHGISGTYAERYHDLERYIDVQTVRDAFCVLLATDGYCVYPNRKKPSVNFRDGARRGDPIPYAFIVTRQHLKFYVRKVAYESWQPLKERLAGRFGERFDPREYKSNINKLEWRIDIICTEDVAFVYDVAPKSPYPLWGVP